MKCPRCGYEWESRIPNPKECPRCKQRMDYVGALEIKKGGVKKVTTRTWGAIALIIVVAAGLGIYAWAPWAEVTPVTPVTPAWSSVVFGAAPAKSGIENIYIMKSKQEPNPVTYDIGTDLSGHENILAVITESGQTGNIPYFKNFDVVIAVKAHDDNLAYVQKENVKVEFGTTSVTGTLKRDGAAITSIALENTADADEFVFVTATDYIRLNALTTNWDNLWLDAGAKFDFSAKLWCWG